jgi:hypothetical protein
MRGPLASVRSNRVWAKGPTCASQGQRPWFRAQDYSPSPNGALLPSTGAVRPVGAWACMIREPFQERCPWLLQAGPLALKERRRFYFRLGRWPPIIFRAGFLRTKRVGRRG